MIMQKICRNVQHFIMSNEINLGLALLAVNLEDHLRLGMENILMSANLDLELEKTVGERDMIDALKAPIIQIGKDCGFEVIENYDLGAGPVHVVWNFKPGSEALPDLRLGFVCLTGTLAPVVNEAIARGMLNLMDKLVLVVPSEPMTVEVKDSIESMPDTSILQLRKYITVLTPSTLVSKTEIKSKKSASEVV
jgi:hypothetical protein